MTTIGEAARITVRGEEIGHSRMPADPRDDYPAAAQALWRVLRRRAIAAPRTQAWAEEQDGRRGYAFGFKLLPVIRELWPAMDRSAYRPVATTMAKHYEGNIKCMIRATGDSDSIWWLADEWVPVNRRTQVKYHKKQAPAPAAEPAAVEAAGGGPAAPPMPSPAHVPPTEPVKQEVTEPAGGIHDSVLGFLRDLEAKAARAERAEAALSGIRDILTEFWYG